MRTLSLRKIDNMRRLVAALSHDSMAPAAVAALLRVSYTAARNYLTELERAGVANYDPDRRTECRLHPDPTVARHFLASLADGGAGRRISLRRSRSRHCVNPGAQFLHVLADDVGFPLLLSHLPARRDPLVAALFGPGIGVKPYQSS